ncbi:per1-like protein PGAP5 [Aphomia sociella]
MYRISKKIIILASGVIFTIIYCEFLIYYVVLSQCSWQTLEQKHGQSDVLKTLILTDTHLLGPRKSFWVDRWRREWQMHQAFKTIIALHEPEVVFVLGDLFDEGEFSSDHEFSEYVQRFYKAFAVPEHIKMYIIVGNHDIGFHNNIGRGSAERFQKLLNSPPVQFLTLKNNHFVLINSMAMEGDSCRLCTGARQNIDEIAERLKCSENATQCTDYNLKSNYSRPILLQHFPLYRLSDGVCAEPDAPPYVEKYIPFRLKIDALSKEATEDLIFKLKPRVVFDGHTHYGCLLHHSYHSDDQSIEFFEYTVPSFSWRNIMEPKYMLVTFSPDSYAVTKCGLPRETTIVITAVILFSLTFFLTCRRRPLGRGLGQIKKYSFVSAETSVSRQHLCQPERDRAAASTQPFREDRSEGLNRLVACAGFLQCLFPFGQHQASGPEPSGVDLSCCWALPSATLLCTPLVHICVCLYLQFPGGVPANTHAASKDTVVLYIKMFRFSKRHIILTSGVLFTIVYCEYLIYYVVIAQCGWQYLGKVEGNPDLLKAFILTDTHLPGHIKSSWFDQWRRGWQMHQSFKTIIKLHEPDVIFILGDNFDEAEWSSDDYFKEYVNRFYNTFTTPDNVKMYIIVGNHDIGFHNNMKPGNAERFMKLMNSPSVQLLTLKNNHFVLINSMAMEGDSCDLCTEARRKIDNISEILQCSELPGRCSNDGDLRNYSRPILLQHFPLYRLSDGICSEPDAPPLSEKYVPFRLKIDALSKEATEDLIFKLKPRAAFDGHTHYGCLQHHSYEVREENIDFFEYTVPSFSWRNILEPKYMLVTFTPNTYAVNKCSLPRETTITITAVMMFSLTFLCAYSNRILARRSGKIKKYNLVN